MRMALAIGVLALACAVAAFTADSPAQTLFNQIRGKVRQDLSRVPRYTCVETVTRKQFLPQYGGHVTGCKGLIVSRARIASPGLLVWHDRLRLDVAVGENSEIFSWAGARQFETGGLENLAAHGATGSGDFSAFLTSVFGLDAEGFHYTGEKDTGLGPLAEFTFRVPRVKSHYTVHTGGGAQGIIGYEGSFYADSGTGDLKRLIIDATDFPTGEVCHVYDTMDYNRVRIGTGDFLLPDVARMTVLYANGDETQNETHYSNCHEFTGQTTIRFDDPDEVGSPAAVARAAARVLPPRTRIRVKIDPPINSATAAAGDPITGAVESEVKKQGQVLVRTSDRLHGRILRFEQRLGVPSQWTVAIRFDSIERDGMEEPVTLRPLDDGNRSQQPSQGFGRRSITRTPEPDVAERPQGTGVFLFSKEGNLVLDQKFHSEWETK